jgi:hypothetical protein
VGLIEVDPSASASVTEKRSVKLRSTSSGREQLSSTLQCIWTYALPLPPADADTHVGQHALKSEIDAMALDLLCVPQPSQEVINAFPAGCDPVLHDHGAQTRWVLLCKLAGTVAFGA